MLLAGAGVTLHTCLEAAERLVDRGMPARVIDLYSVKPIDARGPRGGGARRRATASSWSRTTIPRAAWAKPCWPPSRRCDEVFRVEHLAVRGLPGSGTPAELMEAAGISAGDIEAAALRLLGRSSTAGDGGPPAYSRPLALACRQAPPQVSALATAANAASVSAETSMSSGSGSDESFAITTSAVMSTYRY